MNIQTISPTEFSRLVESGQSPILLDVRTPAEFAGAHVAGARSMPLDQLDPATVAALCRRPDEAIYVICQSGGRAASACRQLTDGGLPHVFSIEGGTAAWERAGLPIERSGGKVISLERQVRIGAGLLVLLGAILTWQVHPAFLALPAFVGAGLVFAGVSDYCGMAILLGKMPWNRRIADAGQCKN